MRRAACLALALLLALGLAGCGFTQSMLQPGRLYDNAGVYSQPRDGWSELWLDVSTLNGLTDFAQVTGRDRDDAGEKPRYTALIHDEQGELAPANDPATAQVQIKGNALFRSQYRSYKITLLEDERWLGQRIFTLYKCPEDTTKISMRLGLDAYALFDDMVSVSAGFVRLYLRDPTSGSEEYQDYGLFTAVEHLNSRYLRNHGLDRNGELYEAKGFDFDYEGWMALAEDARDEVLEYGNGSRPQKLEEMLQALDQASAQDFDAVFDRYFDRENYLTWLAGAVLLGNRKAGLDTFQLYSPSDSEKWYFFPAPCDRLLPEAGEGRRTDPPDEYFGVGMLCESALHRRFFQSVENRQALADKVTELRGVLSDGALAELCGDYKLALAEFAGKNPDYGMLGESPQDTEARINRFPQQVAANVELFQSNQNRPAPFHFGEVYKDGGAWVFTWEDASRADETLSWRLVLSSDAEGEQVLFEGEADMPLLVVEQDLKGRVYARLTAVSQNGDTQLANSWVKGASGSAVWGTAMYTVSGEVVAYG